MNIWYEKRILLGILAVLLAGNTVFFFTYRVQYERRLQDLEDRRQQVSARLAQEHAQRLTAERRIAGYRRISGDVQEIYNKQWATEAERLTALIAEVKRLAVASELVPRSISYSRGGSAAKTEAQRKARTQAEIVTISFTVQGNYQQVRRLINLLELSQQFVIIDQVTLAAAEGQSLTLTLQLKTLFRDTLTPSAKES
jgi:hypothetical protein